VVMCLVYYFSVTTVGGWATGWANDGLFGDGYFLFGRGSEAYGEEVEAYGEAQMKAEQFLGVAERHGIDITPLLGDGIDPIAESLFIAEASRLRENVVVVDPDSGEVVYEGPVTLDDWLSATEMELPDPANFGVWIPGLPVVLGDALQRVSVAPWLEGLIMDGVVAGVGAVLGFVPQMMVLFLFLAILEGCGYMARISFILDKIFRRFGLSGKSIIPMLITTGCGVPGVTASRTIESHRDRRMTVMTTTFVPCGAKLPIIAMIAAAFFGGTWWVAPSAYFLGIAAVLFSGAILKKTKMFRGEEAAFVMELPLYHLPTLGNVLKSMWERAWDFIRRAGTLILLASIFIWFMSNFGWVDGSFGMLDGEMEGRLLAMIGSAVAWIFAPLGFGTWQAAVSTLLGLVAKEGVVSTMSILYGLGDGQGYAALTGVFTLGAAYAFMVFNLLCAPCFAAIAAIRQEMNSAKWFWFAIGYQTVFAYAVALCFYQFWKVTSGGGFSLGTVAAILVVIGFIMWLFRRDSNGRTKTMEKVRERATA
ncbi:MAG: ferrous iron transporter B, partial [Halodesulfovibrio sp.]